MATKAKDTPILKGRDAEVFNQKMRITEKNPISKTEYERMIKNFNKVIII